MERSKLKIQKVSASGIEGLTHCWVPSIDGRVLEYLTENGSEPCRSVRAARQVIARHLNVHPKEIQNSIEVIR